MRSKAILVAIILINCTVLNAQNLNIPAFGNDSTFEMMTWNIEWFPKSGQTTVDYVSEIILDLQIDVIAMQELDDTYVFDQMINNMDDYTAFYESSYFAGLAYIYNHKNVSIDTIYEIYTTQPYWRTFPRSPVVMELMHNNTRYIIINNHFKCCGDGTLDESDPWDEEKRRLDASDLLEEYIHTNFQNEIVLMTGDLNDDIAEPVSNNVFTAFLNEPELYRFADMAIAEGPVSGWSYPNWPSHLDHILITHPLFREKTVETYYVETLKIDEYFDSWNQYDAFVTDHRPVAIKIYAGNNLDTYEITENDNPLIIYPNPSSGDINIIIEQSGSEGILAIYSTNGSRLISFDVDYDRRQFEISSKTLASGIYWAMYYENRSRVVHRKIIVLD